MKRCPHCGRQADTAQLFCENCGHRMEEIQEESTKRESAEGKKNREQEDLLKQKEQALAKTAQECERQKQEAQRLRAELEQKTRESEKAKKKKVKWTIFTLVFLLASGCLAVVCFILADDLDYAESRVSDLRSDYYDLENDMEGLLEQAEFFDEYIVFVGDDMEHYHKYGCELWEGQDFLAFNIDAAVMEGYVPCEECWGEAIDLS